MGTVSTELLVTLGLALVSVALAGLAFWRTGRRPSVDDGHGDEAAPADEEAAACARRRRIRLVIA